MPVLHVNYTDRKPKENKRDFIETCVNIIVEESGCSDAAVRVFLQEHDSENARNEKPVVFLNWMEVPEKRTPEVKDRIASRITDKLCELTGASKDEVLILINDYPPKHIAVGGKCRR